MIVQLLNANLNNFDDTFHVILSNEMKIHGLSYLKTIEGRSDERSGGVARERMRHKKLLTLHKLLMN